MTIPFLGKQKIKTLLSSDVAKAVAAMVSVNVLTATVGIVGSLIQGRFVTAEELGFFKQFSIATSYLFFLHLGSFHAVERLYPYYKGKKEDKKAYEVVETASSWVVLICLVITAVFAVLTVKSLIGGDWKSGLCWFVQIVTIWGTLYGGFLQATYRSGKEFQSMARSTYLNPFLSEITIPLYWVQPFITMAIRSCTSMASVIRLHIRRPVKTGFSLNKKSLLNLFSEGLPLFSASYINSTGLDAIRNSIILAMLGLTDLGLWTFSYQFLIIIFMLPSAVTAVYAPRVVEKFAATESVSEAMKVARQPIKIGLLLSLAIVPLGILITYIFLPKILPNYANAIMIMIVLLLATPLKLSDIYMSVISATRNRLLQNVISLMGFVTNVGVAVLGIVLGWGVISFAVSFFMGYVVRTICFMISIWKVSAKLEKSKISNNNEIK